MDTAPQPLAEPGPEPEPAPAAAPIRAVQPQRLPMSGAILWLTAAACGLAGVGAVVSGGGAGLAWAAAASVLALAAAAATRLPPAAQRAGLTLLLMALTAALAAHAVDSGAGLAAPALSLPGLFVCLLAACSGWRGGALLAAFAALALAAVAWLAAPLPADAARYAAMHGSALALGLAGGALIARAIAAALQAGGEREQRLRGLLALAADGYWEIDREYRIVAAADRGAEPRELGASDGRGAVPWELPQFGCDAETLDRLQADLDARLPFRDLALHWRGRGDFLVSGEPRFDERGIFTGYWGVARDVTAIRSAQQALAATETRYQELFSHIPTPLVLHRGGRILDANPAALALFGRPEQASLVGTDLFACYAGGDSRERARRRMEQLQGQPEGTALPVTDFKLELPGRVVSVRATSVRVDTAGGPALLAIFVDESERLAAEEALRRSEALLSHLVATSPDLITLSEMGSGRYAMVNQSFERVSGWTAAEAVGRTETELGLWESAEARDRLVRTVREQGSVSDLPQGFRAKDGSRFALIVSAAHFVMDSRDYLVINARDVTAKERERLEREAILANASIGIAVTRQRRFVLANRHFERIYGWSRGELVGQPGAVVWMNEADYAALGAQYGPALARGEVIELERGARRKDGSSFTARVRGRAIDPARPADGGTVWIVEDVTGQRQAERALARARDDAEAASRAKSAFLANTSHELRTPLHGLIGLARLARDEHLGEERRRVYLDQIVQSAEALAGIISDILDLSRVGAGRLRLEAVPFALDAELAELHRSYAVLAAGRELALQLDLADDLAGAVLGDPLRLRQVVGNFLANAVKFSAGGRIVLRARRLPGTDPERVRFEVEDSGPGIDEATRARLFQPFTQADDSTTRRHGGAGLGLSICRELATLMGGAVGVDSAAGRGSTFWAELPLPRVPAAASPPAPLRSLDGVRVLMVEDNPVNMLIAVALLERWGVRVAQARDGHEALALVQRAAAAGQPFDAVLMDVQMPVMSGHEAARALRALPGGSELPIVALTAAALASERDEALRAGMNDFLTKPIDAERLHATLLRWCRQPA